MFTSRFFNMGQIFITQGIHAAMADNNRFALEVSLSLKRYSVKDWGDLSEDDKQLNNDALGYPDDLNLLAAYQTSLGKIHIITNRISENPGDNVTTVCFPMER